MVMRYKFGLLALGLLIISASATAPCAMADGIDPLDVNRRRTEDPFSNQNNPSSEPVFDVMHRAQLGNIRSLPEFSKDQQDSLGSEASDFRTRQRALIQQSQPQTAPTQPVSQSTSQPATP
jgi:hypothetical protein